MEASQSDAAQPPLNLGTGSGSIGGAGSLESQSSKLVLRELVKEGDGAEGDGAQVAEQAGGQGEGVEGIGGEGGGGGKGEGVLQSRTPKFSS